MRMKKLPRIYKFIVSTAVFLLVVLSAVALYVAEQGNFHAITTGQAYRSAQLDTDEFAYCIKKYQIRSILNLRGRNPGETWYKDELNVSLKNNVAHYDIALSADIQPKAEDVRNILEVLIHAPRPILIHCKAGADRSGLVAAMWKTLIDKEPKEEARKQL